MSIIRTVRALALSAALLCAAPPAPAAAAEVEATENECHDYVWARYNDCLMTEGFWLRYDCDRHFYLTMAFCTILPYLTMLILMAW